MVEERSKYITTLDQVADKLLKKTGLDKDGKKIIWEHEPVNIVEFVENPYYLNLKESCRNSVMDDLVNIFGLNAKQVSPNFNYAIFSEAVGTGKTYRQAIMAIYQVYKLLCLRDPINYFNTLNIPGQPKLSPGSKIAIILMAVTADNARKVIYSEIGTKIANCSWFRDYYPPNPKIKTERQFDPLPAEFQSQHDKVYKNIYIIPGSSSEYAAVGYNIFMGVIDEATLFEDIKDKSLMGGADVNDQGEIVFSTLDSRIKSRFMGQGLLVIAGNPKHSDDFLERHTSDSIGRGDTYIVSRRPVWASTFPEFNTTSKNKDGEYKYPHFYFNLNTLRIVEERMKNVTGVIAIPNMFKDDFARTPEVAKRDLAGYPTSAVGRVIANPDIVLEKCNKERQVPIITNVPLPNPPVHHLSPELKREHLAWHGIHIDVGETQDAAAMCVSHPYGFDDSGEPLIYTDLIVRWQGAPDNPVDIGEIVNWILYLRDNLDFHIGKITADKFQSSYLLQHLNTLGFRTGILSTDSSKDPYDELIQTIRSDRNDFYNHSVAIHELMNLERHKGKYDHGRRGSKDASDAWAGSTYNSIRLATIPPPIDIKYKDKTGSRALTF